MLKIFLAGIMPRTFYINIQFHMLRTVIKMDSRDYEKEFWMEQQIAVMLSEDELIKQSIEDEL